MKRGIVLVSIVLLLVVPIVNANYVSDFMDKFLGIGFIENKVTGYASLSELLSSKIETEPTTTEPITVPSAITPIKTITQSKEQNDLSNPIIKNKLGAVSTQFKKIQPVRNKFKKIEMKKGSYYFNNNKLQLQINSVRNGKVFAKIVKDVSSPGEITNINGKCYRSQPIEGGLRLTNVNCPSNFGVKLASLDSKKLVVAPIKKENPVPVKTKMSFFSRLGALFR